MYFVRGQGADSLQVDFAGSRWVHVAVDGPKRDCVALRAGCSRSEFKKSVAVQICRCRAKKFFFTKPDVPLNHLVCVVSWGDLGFDLVSGSEEKEGFFVSGRAVQEDEDGVWGSVGEDLERA